MAGENDQTKWRGIRPTNPAENIPVTESAPLTDILVAPSAGSPEFLTRTRKRAPAIADLQAVEDVILLEDDHIKVGVGHAYRDIYTVLEGNLGVAKTFVMTCTTANPGLVYPYIKRGGVYYYLTSINYTVAGYRYIVNLTAYGIEDDIFGCRWSDCANGDRLITLLSAYIVPTY